MAAIYDKERKLILLHTEKIALSCAEGLTAASHQYHKLIREEASGEVYTGAALMYAGVPIPAMIGEYQAVQMHFIRTA